MAVRWTKSWEMKGLAVRMRTETEKVMRFASCCENLIIWKGGMIYIKDIYMVVR